MLLERFSTNELTLSHTIGFADLLLRHESQIAN